MLLTLIFTVFLAGCGSYESGEISFEAPTKENAKFHDPDNGPLSISVAINSTFDVDKEARLYVDGLGPYSCWLAAGITSTCNNVSLAGPGVHTLRAEVDKIRGKKVEVSSAQISVDWSPYSPMDVGMIKIAGLLGSNDPVFGFNLVAFLISGVLAIFALRMGKFGAIIAFVLMAFGLAYFAPVEVTALIIKGIYGVIGGYFTVIIIKMILDSLKHVAFVNARRADGSTFTGAYLGEGGPNANGVFSGLGNVAQKSMGAAEQQQSLQPGYYDQPPQILPGRVVGSRPPRRGLSKILRGE